MKTQFLVTSLILGVLQLPAVAGEEVVTVLAKDYRFIPEEVTV